MLFYTVLLNAFALLSAGSYAYIDDLGNNKFTARERASERLAECGALAYPALCIGKHFSRDLEIRSRCRRLLSGESTEKLLSDAFPTPKSYPFLDSLWYDVESKSYKPFDSLWYNKAMSYISNAACYREEQFNSLNLGQYRQATKQWTYDGIERGVPLFVYKVIFKELHRRDQVYLNKNYSKPIDFVPTEEAGGN